MTPLHNMCLLQEDTHEASEERVEKPEDVVKKGDTVTAKCIGVDDRGRVKMSIRAAAREAKQQEAAEEAPVEA